MKFKEKLIWILVFVTSCGLESNSPQLLLDWDDMYNELQRKYGFEDIALEGRSVYGEENSTILSLRLIVREVNLSEKEYKRMVKECLDYVVSNIGNCSDYNTFIGTIEYINSDGSVHRVPYGFDYSAIELGCSPELPLESL